MKPLELGEILDNEHYAAVRDRYRARVLAHKKDRRVSIGDRVTLVFEDRETIRYQIQEMARIEQLRGDQRIQHEIDAYNALVPGDRELSATLFIEITDLDEIRPELSRLVGIDECLALVLGEDGDEETVVASFDESQIEAERISAVHYVRFRLAPQQVPKFAQADRIRLRIEHENYRHDAEVGPALRSSLSRDLQGGCPSFLDLSTVAPRDSESNVNLLTSQRIRAYRPREPRADQHIVVESIDEIALPDADPDLLAEIMAAVQQFARELGGALGSCRIVGDGSPAGRGRLRWQILAPDRER